ncbi:hypothetical protein AB840_08110 [Megasphaera cerevisiae DSM 20462]|uniref:Uncharacterized protein n=1 Tax=Megasphaera cerevisiae DSM 20462 TaxID=1122219 RepID=A0A0J6ZNE3_9FIRM|nr:hypothetical protein [Megasphaera cerevisiae]KMO86421.1 hypothetical protein AB840_08110 [Megasphaera cerevisiae DSM 20462]SJZ72280.1 hypothetical protein SAMN05660900_01275 [Megasphaera cerevisiae DSM 20462]
MSLQDDMGTEMAELLFNADEFAEEAAYVSKGVEQTISVLADIGTATGTKRNPKEVDKSYGEATFTIREADVPQPHAGDFILYHGIKYTFVAVEAYMNGVYDVRFTSGLSGVSVRRLQ